MPRFLVPKRHGPHRVAAIALFRALLAQSSVAQVAPEEQRTIQHVIRSRFQANKHLTSRRLLRDAFTAGYNALDYLDAAATGDQADFERVRTILAELPPKLKNVPPPREQSKRSSVEYVEPLRPNTSIFDRPRPKEELKGKRRVPYFVATNGVPFLRFHARQPENLSRFIRHRIDQQVKRTVLYHELVEVLELAEFENQWDEILYAKFGIGSTAGSTSSLFDQPSWKAEHVRGLWTVKRLSEEAKVSNAIVAAKMHDIVVKERELAAKEEQELRESRSEVETP